MPTSTAKPWSNTATRGIATTAPRWCVPSAHPCPGATPACWAPTFSSTSTHDTSLSMKPMWWVCRRRYTFCSGLMEFGKEGRGRGGMRECGCLEIGVYDSGWFACLFVTCLTSQKGASVLKAWMCLDNCMFHHTMITAAQTCCLIQS